MPEKKSGVFSSQAPKAPSNANQGGPGLRRDRDLGGRARVVAPEKKSGDFSCSVLLPKRRKCGKEPRPKGGGRGEHGGLVGGYQCWSSGRECPSRLAEEVGA